MSLGTRVQITINMGLHVFQWQPFTLIQVRVTHEVNNMPVALI